MERDLLYAQAWALVHHARHAADRRFASLEVLARRLAGVEGVDASVRATYATDLEALDTALQAYVRREILKLQDRR